MKNWKFCKTYDWIFENENISSKNIISDDKLTIMIIESKLKKTKRHKQWKFIFNIKNHYNNNINEIDAFIKINFQKQWYYVSIKNYVIYKNKKKIIKKNCKRKSAINLHENFYVENHKMRKYQKILKN